MKRVKIIEAHSCASQRDSLEYLSKRDASASYVLDKVNSYIAALSLNPYAKIGTGHHKLVFSGLRKGSYACGFPSTSQWDFTGFRFNYYVFEKKHGSWIDVVPDFVLSHLSPTDAIDYDYVVFIQDVFWDYHDVDSDSKRLKHRDSSDLSREEWISRQEASFIRGGVSPASARRLAEDYYDIRALRGDYSAVYIQNPDKSFTKL